MKKSVWVLAVGALLLVLGGCTSAQDTISQMKAELKADMVTDEEDQLTAQNDGLTVPDMNDITIEETYQPVPTAGEPTGPLMTVDLYFASADGKSLVKQEKSIPKAEGMARATIEALLAGPGGDSGLRSAVPAGTELKDINVKADSGLCIVDFSEELADAGLGDIAEDVTVYAIANTLCQFPTVSQVEFRIEGQAVTTLSGNADLSRAVSADFALVSPQ